MLIQYCRTEFSIGNGLLSPKGAVTTAIQQGYAALLLADTMSISALIPATLAAQKIEPTFRVLCGTRLVIVDDPFYEHQRRIAKENNDPLPAAPCRERNYSFIAIAKNEAGFSDLCQLLSLANNRDQFFQSPRLALEQVLATFALGNIVLMHSDADSVQYRSDANAIMDKLLSAGSHDDFLAAVYPINTPLYDQINAKTLTQSKHCHLSPIAFSPAYYESEENADDKDLMYLVANNVKPDQHYRIRAPFQRDSAIIDRAQSIATLAAMGDRTEQDINKREWLKDTQQALLDKCLYQWQQQAPCLPKMADDEVAELRKLTKKGLKWRLTHSCFGYIPNKDQHAIYAERVKYELSILETMGFSGYFLLVRDVMNFARERHIPVGCGRGSVGGSLVAFCLGITEIDPMRFGLLFERFINPERHGLPDADLDLSQARRHEVMDYLTAKYGQDYVAGIVSYTYLKTPSAFRDVARVLGHTNAVLSVSKEISNLEKTLGSLTLEDAATHIPRLNEFARLQPELFASMGRLRGHMKGYGRHASGFIVSSVPINTRAVMERRSDELVINWDMSCCEENGLIKLDLLGLANLDLMALACQYIKERHDVDINMYDIPLDDEKTLANFAKAETTGVFQLESSGMKKVLSDLGSGIKPMTFETIVHTTALFRPGPMQSGALDQFVSVAKGFCEIEPLHPLLDDLLHDTNGVMIYQEQVMSALRILAGFSLGEADLVRRAMGKKKIDLMKTMADDFVKRCALVNSIPESQAIDIWNKIEAFAGYGFNKSHSAAYSCISAQVMYVKTHYPAEFFAAALSILPSDKHAGLVLNAREYGIDLYPPCVNHSTSRLEIATKGDKTILYAPLSVVKGCSDTSANIIVQSRNDAGGQFKDRAAFDEFVPRRNCNIRLREYFEKIGAFHCFEPESLSPLDPARRQDQSLYMPDMTIDPVESVRAFVFDAKKKALINRHHKRIEDELDLGCEIVRPSMPNKPKLAIILDYANKNDASCGYFAERNYEDYLHNLMEEVGFGRDDYYVTGIKKSEKSGGYSSELELAYKTYFAEEMDLLDAPVILAMGRESVDYFSGGGKQKASDLQGRTTFDAARQATIIYGINPMILYPRPELREDVISILNVAFLACYGDKA